MESLSLITHMILKFKDRVMGILKSMEVLDGENEPVRDNTRYRHKDVAVQWCTWNRGKVLIWTFLDYQSSSLGHPNSGLDRSAVPERKNLGNI